MRRLLTILLLLATVGLAGAAVATNYTTTDITVTNIAVTGDTIVINGVTRTWTNATTSTTVLTNLAGINETATNLWRALSLNRPVSPYLLVSMTSTNTVRLQGTAAAVTAAGDWCSIATASQLITNRYGLILPWDTLPAAERTNQASELVYGLANSTNAIPAAASAVSNLVGRGNNQIVEGAKTWTGTNGFAGPVDATNAAIYSTRILSGTVGILTNGLWKTGIADSLTVTNLAVPGAGDFSVRIGESSTSDGNNSVALGSSATADAEYSTALGSLSGGDGYRSTSLGAASSASGGDSIAIGADAQASSSNSIAIGTGSASAYANSIVIGNGSTATTSNQIVIGASGHNVSIPGQVTSLVTSNTVLRGSNYLDGDLAAPVKVIATVADGANTLSLLGTNYTMFRLTGTVTADASLAGLTGGRNGRICIFENRLGYNLTLLHESGLDATPANRISSPSSADLNIPNAGWFTLVYDSTASRWKVQSAFPTTVLALGSMSIYDVTNIYVLGADTWLTITNWTSSAIATNVTAGLATGKLTVGLAGWYRIGAHLSYGGKDVGGDAYEAAIKRGDGTVSTKAESYGSATSTDRHSASCGTFAYLTNSEVIALQIKSVAGDDMDVFGAQLNVELIRP